MKAALRLRLEALRAVAADMRHAPLTTLFSAAVVAIALALPAALLGSMGALQHLVAGWNRGEQISVYLHRNVPDTDAQQLAARLRSRTDVAAVSYLSPAAGLRQLSASGHFGSALALLPQNPLPPVLVVTPATTVTPGQLRALVTIVKQNSEVASVQADLAWARRLAAGVAIARRAGALLAGAFAIAIMVILGNNARLQIIDRRHEIELMLQVGARNSFVRRPFVYAGALAGLAGGLLGWLLLRLGAWALSAPVARLALLYQSQFTLQGPGVDVAGGLMLAGLVLGALGAWLAVGRQLNHFLP